MSMDLSDYPVVAEPIVLNKMDDYRLIRLKIADIITEFGQSIVRTPLSELIDMLNVECEYSKGKSLFCNIWNKYRFMPTADLIRRFGDPNQVNAREVAEKLDHVWCSVSSHDA